MKETLNKGEIMIISNDKTLAKVRDIIKLLTNTDINNTYIWELSQDPSATCGWSKINRFRFILNGDPTTFIMICPEGEVTYCYKFDFLNYLTREDLSEWFAVKFFIEYIAMKEKIRALKEE